MPKESSFVLKFCSQVIRYCVYALIFLLPLFFLPWTSDVLDFNKQALLLLLGFTALFFWMVKVLVSGKLEIRLSRMHTIVGALFLVYVLSTILSAYRYGSFWGWPQITSESLASLLGLVVFYFLVSNVFSRSDIFKFLIILSVSSLIAELAAAFQLFGLFILPFSFAKSVAFNTVGSIGSLGILSASLLPLFITLLVVSKKWWRVLFAFQLLVSGLLLFFINYSMVWWVAAAGCFFVVIVGIIKRNVFDGRWMALPMFFLVISLFFAIFGLQTGWLAQSTNEIFLSSKTSAEVSLQTIKEAPLLGSGPGTFSFDFLKFKNADFSKTSLWNIVFDRAGSEVLTALAAIGVLGFLALLALIILPILYGTRFLFSSAQEEINPEKNNDVLRWILALGSTGVLFSLGVAYFLYNSNIVLSFVSFLVIACLVCLVSDKKKEYKLKYSSLTTIIITFGITFVFIFGLGVLIMAGQRYSAEVSYYEGLSKLKLNQIDAGIKKLTEAASANPSSDLYFRQLSQAYLIKLQQEMQNVKSGISVDEKNKIQALEANAINTAKIATDLNPRSATDWSARGYVYQSLFGLTGDAGIWALNSYSTALKLNPNDPYLFAQLGNVNLSLALQLPQSSAAQKAPLLAQAKEKLEKSLSLNPNYSDAMFYLGLVYDSLGDKDKAKEQFNKVAQLNPGNKDILQILDNLNNGKPALQPATLPPANPTSSKLPAK